LIAIGAVTFVINYTKQPSPITQPIKLPVKEKISVPEEGERLESVKIVEIEKIKDEIKTEVEGELIKYQEESFYSTDDFSVILGNEDEFESQLIERLKGMVIGVEVSNFEINLNQSKKTAILKCEIKGAMYATNQYNMHFLLGALNLDLWDDFKPYQPPYGKNLTYEEKIDGVPTKIIFEFPYELSHCHEHVWPK